VQGLHGDVARLGAEHLLALVDAPHSPFAESLMILYLPPNIWPTSGSAAGAASAAGAGAEPWGDRGSADGAELAGLELAWQDWHCIGTGRIIARVAQNGDLPIRRAVLLGSTRDEGTRTPPS